jgi:hypothetical protein
LSSGVPAVSPGGKFAENEHGRGEAERGVVVAALAVGVAAELTVVRQPRVGGFDDPAEPECDGSWLVVAGLASALDDVIVEVNGIELPRIFGSSQPRSRWMVSISSSQPLAAMASMVGSRRRTSLRLAPPIAQPSVTHTP